MKCWDHQRNEPNVWEINSDFSISNLGSYFYYLIWIYWGGLLDKKSITTLLFLWIEIFSEGDFQIQEKEMFAHGILSNF